MCIHSTVCMDVCERFCVCMRVHVCINDIPPLPLLIGDTRGQKGGGDAGEKDIIDEEGKEQEAADGNHV